MKMNKLTNHALEVAAWGFGWANGNCIDDLEKATPGSAEWDDALVEYLAASAATVAWALVNLENVMYGREWSNGCPGNDDPIYQTALFRGAWECFNHHLMEIHPAFPNVA